MRPLAQRLRKLWENRALPVLLHPRVVANHLRYERERRLRPLVMRSRPTSVEIELTSRCNLACTQCLRSRGLRPYALGDITAERFERLLAQFPETLNLALNGFGEPLLHPRLPELVRLARARLPWAKIGIYTNGQLLDDEERVQSLLGCGLTEIDVSIDAARPETYRRIRRGGELETVHRGVRRLLQARRAARAHLPMVGVNFVMVNDNEGELSPFVEQAAALQVDFVNCITFASYDWGFQNRRSPDSYLRELAAARRRLDALKVRCKSFPSADLTWATPDRPFGCGFFWGEEFRVTFEGHVTLGCCTPFRETYSYGSLLEQPLEAIWNGPAFQRNRALERRAVPPTAACASCDRFQRRFFAPPPPIAPQ